MVVVCVSVGVGGHFGGWGLGGRADGVGIGRYRWVRVGLIGYGWLGG